jgi:histidine triad (HIT) family protein
MMSDCIFCKIVNKQVPAAIVFENENVLAFRDIRPKAPTHILIIPKRHIPTVNDILPEDGALIGEIFQVAKTIAQQEKIQNNGYRLVMNCNRDGGQEVYHIHLHLLGGRRMNWPPG